MLDEEFYVSGYMTIPDYVYPTKLESDIVADPNSFGITVISKNKMSEMNNSIETINIRYNSALSPDIKEYLNTNFGIMFWQNIDDNPRYTMVKGEVTSLRQVTLSIPMAIFLLTAAGIVVTLRALRLSPVKLMRGHGQKNKVGIFEKNMNLRRFKFKTKFIIREILRSFSKIIIIILGVTASSMLLLLGSVAQDSFDYLVKDGMNNSFKYKYNYVFKTPMKANTYKGEEYNAAPFTSLDKKKK